MIDIFTLFLIMSISLEIYTMIDIKNILLIGEKVSSLKTSSSIKTESKTQTKPFSMQDNIFVLLSVLYFAFCIYLLFTPYFLYGIILFIISFMSGKIKKMAPKKNPIISRLDSMVCILILSLLLFQYIK